MGLGGVVSSSVQFLGLASTMWFPILLHMYVFMRYHATRVPERCGITHEPVTEERWPFLILIALWRIVCIWCTYLLSIFLQIVCTKEGLMQS